jgi:hypothetical protein
VVWFSVLAFGGMGLVFCFCASYWDVVLTVSCILDMVSLSYLFFLKVLFPELYGLLSYGFRPEPLIKAGRSFTTKN